MHLFSYFSLFPVCRPLTNEKENCCAGIPFAIMYYIRKSTKAI